MAESKSGSTRKRPSSSAKAASRNGTKRAAQTRKTSTGTRRRTSSSASRRSTPSRATSANSNRSNGRVPDAVKRVASKAKAPAVAVGAAAAGVAGGLVLKNRMRRKTVLGVPVPRALTKGISDLDPKSVAKTVGQVSKQFAKTSKSVSKDLERAGDQAERIGKILD
jgi:hypothetical protein